MSSVNDDCCLGNTVGGVESPLGREWVWFCCEVIAELVRLVVLQVLEVLPKRDRPVLPVGGVELSGLEES